MREACFEIESAKPIPLDRQRVVGEEGYATRTVKCLPDGLVDDRIVKSDRTKLLMRN